MRKGLALKGTQAPSSKQMRFQIEVELCKVTTQHRVREPVVSLWQRRVLGIERQKPAELEGWEVEKTLDACPVKNRRLVTSNSMILCDTGANRITTEPDCRHTRWHAFHFIFPPPL